MNPARAIIVLGMHRSGTSAMTGLLHLLGVELGGHLMPPNPYNEAGHWEHADLVAIHDRLLATLGSAWDDACPLPDGWCEREAVGPLRAGLLAAARRDFGQSPLWGLKDPRLCRLLPLWHGIVAELGARAGFVIMVRDPVEVAASLRRRDGFTPAYAHLLWLEHCLATERHARGAPRVFVEYDELLRDWRAVARRLGTAFDLAWPTPPEAASAAADRFLSAALRHHRRDDDPTPASPWVERLHTSLQAAARGDEDALRDGATAVEAEVAPVRPLLYAGLAELQHRLAHRDAGVGALTADVERLVREARERDARLARVEAESAVRAAHLAALERHLHDREAQLVPLAQENAARAEVIRALEAERAALTGALAALRAEAERARTTLEASAAGRLLLRFVPGAAPSAAPPPGGMPPRR